MKTCIHIYIEAVRERRGARKRNVMLLGDLSYAFRDDTCVYSIEPRTLPQRDHRRLFSAGTSFPRL